MKDIIMVVCGILLVTFLGTSLLLGDGDNSLKKQSINMVDNAVEQMQEIADFKVDDSTSSSD